MRVLKALKATALVAAAIVLGLLTASGAHALWTSVVSVNAGTVQAANFSVLLNGGATDAEMVTPQGTGTLALQTSTLSPLKAGQSAFAGVRITNNTNASGAFTVNARLEGAPVVGDFGGVPGTAQYLEIRSVVAAGITEPSACNNPALFTAAVAGQAPGTDIAKGQAAVICFQATLRADAPPAINGKASVVSIPLAVDQVVR